jgi:hypothetical protein
VGGGRREKGEGRREKGYKGILKGKGKWRLGAKQKTSCLHFEETLLEIDQKELLRCTGHGGI